MLISPTVLKADLERWLALAEAAYTTGLPSGFELLGRIVADPAKTHALIDPSRRDFGFVAREVATGEINVWFRGTEDPCEWLDDAEALLIPHPGAGMVHAGFYGLFDALIDSVTASVPRGSPGLTFGGHSLGAPLATYTAIHRWAGRNLVTFESPRTGDNNFADYVEANTATHLRVLNYADIVPHLPPRPLFSHAGGFIGFQHSTMDLRTAHSLELSVAPAIAAMADSVMPRENLR